MRIALNHTYLRIEGGVERYVYRLTEGLLRRGFQVDFFGLKKSFPETKGLRFIRVPVLKGSEAFKILSFALNSASLIKNHGPYDAVIGFGKTFYHTVYRDGSGISEEYEKHVEKRGPIKGAVVRWIERKRFTFPLLKRVIAVSRMVADQIRKRYGFSDIDVLYSAVDIESFERIPPGKARKELEDLGASGRLILFAGNGFRRKGLDMLLKALSEQPIKKWSLFVLGRDRNLKGFKNLAEKLGLGERVYFMGFRKDRELFFMGSDLFCLPTRFDPIANVVLEAVSCGLFCLSSPKAGGSELIKPRDGIVFRDYPSLKKALEFSLSCGIPRGRVKKEFSWDAHIERFIDAINGSVMLQRGEKNCSFQQA